MWQCYALAFIVSAVFAPFSTTVSSLLIAAAVIVGLPAIIIIYKKVIWKKYKSE